MPANRARQPRPPPARLLRRGAAAQRRPAGRTELRRGKVEREAGARPRVLPLALGPICPGTSPSQLSLWECSAVQSTPPSWGTPSCPHVRDTAPLPTGLPSRPLRAVSTVRRCGWAKRNHQALLVCALSNRVALWVEDAQRKRKRREKRRGPEKKKSPNIHTRTQNQLWGWTFSISHEATWSIWRRFLKTFRREGEFSAEKLNLPYSSGPIWDLSLLTAPQGTAMIFCTACTPRNTLLNQRMSARPISAERAGEFHPGPPPPHGHSQGPSRLPSTLIKSAKETEADAIARKRS